MREKFLTILKLVLIQLREPRVWAALTPILGGFGIYLDPGLTQSLILLASGLFALISVFTAEAKRTEIKTVQDALGVKPDGWIGPKTIAAAIDATTPK